MLDYYGLAPIIADADVEQLLWNHCSGNLATRILEPAPDSGVLVGLLTGRWAPPFVWGPGRKGPPVVNRPAPLRVEVVADGIVAQRAFSGIEVDDQSAAYVMGDTFGSLSAVFDRCTGLLAGLR